jgi:antitoxin FitA
MRCCTAGQSQTQLPPRSTSLTAQRTGAIELIAGEIVMGSLIVRGVDDELITRLKARAAAHGRSAEAEHREILRRVLSEGSSEMPFGALRGKIRMAPDFDQTPGEIIDAMEAGIA